MLIKFSRKKLQKYALIFFIIRFILFAEFFVNNSNKKQGRKRETTNNDLKFD